MKKIYQGFLKNIISILLSITIIVTSLLVLFYHYRQSDGTDAIAQLERKLLDWRFNLRGPIKPTGKVGILALDEKSIQRFGQWPFPRKVYQKAFENLKTLGVDWIGFDVIYSEPERPLLEDARDTIAKMKVSNVKVFKQEVQELDEMMRVSTSDRKLVKGVKEFERVTLGYFYYQSKADAAMLGKDPFPRFNLMESSAIAGAILPDGKTLDDYPDSMRAHGALGNTAFISSSSEHFGFFSNEPDEDAIVRWVTLVKIIKGQLMPSLSLKTVAESLNREIIVFFDAFGIEEIALVSREDDSDMIKIPVDPDGRGRMLVNHRGPSQTIEHFSLSDAYDNKFTAEQKKNLKGKMLLMGPTAIGISDLRPNPFDPTINGVENHAAAIDNIAKKDFIKRPVSIYQIELYIVLGVGLLFAPLVIFGRALFSGLAVLLFLGGYFYFDHVYWFGKGIWAYMGVPSIEIMALFFFTTIYKYMTEEKERKKVKGAFQYYLSPDVIDQVLENPDSLKLGGERKELTVFFSDVRSFTTISESLTPEKLCELMNDYFTPMTGIILKTGGVLDKYIGDAIMAFWGAPLITSDHADRAALASIQMLYELDKLQEMLPKKGFPKVDIGIGLNTGLMSVGNMGSHERFCYTVMGDSVNLGSRLEGLTKEYGIKIMISEFTQRKLTRKDLFVRDLDDIRVKGKLEPVKVFELMRPDILKTPDQIKNLIGEFEDGRKFYREQNWQKAKDHFFNCLKIRANDGPTQVYLERVEEYLKEKQHIDKWDGVYTFKHK